MKGILFSIVLCLFALTSQFDYNLDQINYEKIVVNPYRVLGVAPWSSMKAIKKQYRTLVKKYHPDKNKGRKDQFRLIQKAYEEVKTKRNESEDSDIEKTLKDMVKETFSDIMLYESLFALVYFVCFGLYKVQTWIVKPLIYQIVTWSFFSVVMPHIFDNEIAQYWTSFVSGVVLFGCGAILKRMCCGSKAKTE